MKNRKTINRTSLKNKIGKALKDDIKPLSNELQGILIDDLATAFESRLLILNEYQPKNKLKVQTFVNLGMEVPNETV
jgi:hypothetical protein